MGPFDGNLARIFLTNWFEQKRTMLTTINVLDFMCKGDD
jgi:hypothetical protein